MKADTVTGTMSAIAVLAFALLILGCASPQKQERVGGAGGEDAARSAQEAKPSAKGADVPPMPSDGDYNCADFETRRTHPGVRSGFAPGPVGRALA
jgi:hypothetical protein